MRTLKSLLIFLGVDPRIVSGATFPQLLTIIFLVVWSPASFIGSILYGYGVHEFREFLWRKMLITYEEKQRMSFWDLLSVFFVDLVHTLLPVGMMIIITTILLS